jgi:hypothetical protein
MLSKGFSGVLKFFHTKIPDLKFPNTTRFIKFILKKLYEDNENSQM